MLLIFDCDGVVLDSMPLHAEVECSALDKVGIKITPADLIRRFSGCSPSHVSATLERESGCKIPEGFDAKVDEDKVDVFTQRSRAIPNINAALDALADVPRCIASGTGVSLLKLSMSIAGLYDRFAPHVYSAEQVEHGKPAPDLFLHAAKSVGVDPKDCIVIEDGIPGVQAAKAAGMRVLGFVGGSHCDEDHADRLRAAGAEHVFSNMAELPDLVASYA